MDKRKMFSILQSCSLVFIILSFILEFKLLLANVFIMYLVVLIALLMLTFAYYGRKKEKGIVAASILLGLFNIMAYGIFGVPDHLANKETTLMISDSIVAVLQLAVIITAVTIIKKK